MRRRLSAALVASVATLTSTLTAAGSPAAVGSTVGPSIPASSPAQRPNILLITTDDQSVEDLRHMPRTRRLVGGHGATFTDAVSPFPLCCPARATLLTGQHAHNHGVLSNGGPTGGAPAFEPVEDRALPVWLSNVGYATTFIGKYLNGYGGDDPSDVPPGWTNWNASMKRIYAYFGPVINRNGVLEDEAGVYTADVAQADTRKAIEAAVVDEKPFFVWQSNLAPHTTCYRRDGRCVWGKPKAAPQDEERFQGLRLRAQDHGAFNERAVADKADHVRVQPLLDRSGVRRMTRFHRARIQSLQAVDRNVAQTVRLLDGLGQLDNTLIIFTSDNGFLLGEHRSFGKVLAFEPSITVPLLMRGPGVPAGVTVDETVALVDIAATVAEAAGAVPLLPQDGRSLLPVANGGAGYDGLPIEAGSVRSAPAGSYFYQGVRTGRYTYLEYPTTGETELFDRQVDPDQLDNVAYRPTHRATRQALAAMLDDLRSCAAVTCRNGGGEVPDPLPPQGPVHPDELAGLGSATQVVTITGRSWSSVKGTAVAWQKYGRTWRVKRGPFRVQLGGNGLIRPGRERHGRAKTPAGLFGVDGAFGVRDDPGTTLRYRRVDKNDRWPHDPEAASTYNVYQGRRPAKASWRPGHEVVWWQHRSRFRLALLLDHNLPQAVRRSSGPTQRVAHEPADVDQGSFIVHTGDRLDRHGWVTAPTPKLRWLLRWADPQARGTVFAVGTEEYLRQHL